MILITQKSAENMLSLHLLCLFATQNCQTRDDGFRGKVFAIIKRALWFFLIVGARSIGVWLTVMLYLASLSFFSIVLPLVQTTNVHKLLSNPG